MAKEILDVKVRSVIGPWYIHFPNEGQCLKFSCGWAGTYDSWTGKRLNDDDFYVEITWDYIDEPLLSDEKVKEFTAALEDLMQNEFGKTDKVSVSFKYGEEDDDGHMWREWIVSFDENTDEY